MTSYSSDTVTDGIRVKVQTRFLPEQSEPQRGLRVFAYTIRIANEGAVPAKLLHRHWVITDSWGHQREVKGPGVVGEQPRLEPGEEFEYTSFCPLPTAHGSMRGTYDMVRDSGERFQARIGEFHLAEPSTSN